MKVQIESTEQIIDLDGVPCRVWKGTTERGIECTVLVHRIRVQKDEDCTEFDAELKEKARPRHDPLL